MLVFGIFLRDNVFYLFEEISGEGRIRFESRECITWCDCLEFDEEGRFLESHQFRCIYQKKAVRDARPER